MDSPRDAARQSPDAGRPSPDAGRRIACYRELLQRYHRTLDLVSDRALGRLDELIDDAAAYGGAIGRFAGAGTVLDLGSGSGLPGAVIAGMFPERSMVWVERRRRRAAFLRQVAASCAFAAVRVLDRDVKAVDRADLPGPLVAVTAQAVGDLGLLMRLTRHLAGPELVLVSRRGSGWQEEIDRARDVSPTGIDVLAAEPLSGDGTLVVVRVAGGE